MVDTRHGNSRGVVRESLAARRKRRARRTFVGYFLAFGAIYGGLWHLAHHPTFAVAAVTVEGNVVSSDEAVASVARGAMGSAALSLLPMTNAYLARAGRIEARIEEALPEVATATVERRDRALAVSIEERGRFGYWCRVGAAGEECFALDGDGFIFAREDAPAGATRFAGLLAAPDPVRERYAPADSWSNLRDVVEALRGRGFRPARVSSQDGVDFRVSLAEGPEILVDVTHSGKTAIENLEIALNDASLASLRAYAYADLRLPHKVFLREGGAEAVEEPVE
jgi:cell division septal protein FtsQ